MRGVKCPPADQHRQVVQKIAVGQKMDRIFCTLAQVNGTQAELHIDRQNGRDASGKFIFWWKTRQGRPCRNGSAGKAHRWMCLAICAKGEAWNGTKKPAHF